MLITNTLLCTKYFICIVLCSRYYLCTQAYNDLHVIHEETGVQTEQLSQS